uniref:Uncharacterized protein n=1 Tax=Meloidogyne enterolobii TaxID=390850 RepID=A0A6V7V2C1_MELEN|nr:unnamed protein product [Meloidogyne enterolobii]
MFNLKNLFFLLCLILIFNFNLIWESRDNHALLKVIVTMNEKFVELEQIFVFLDLGLN